MEKNLNSDGLQFYQYQQNKLSPFILTKLTEHKLTQYMTLEIQVLGQTQYVAELNLLLGSQPCPVDN